MQDLQLDDNRNVMQVITPKQIDEKDVWRAVQTNILTTSQESYVAMLSKEFTLRQWTVRPIHSAIAIMKNQDYKFEVNVTFLLLNGPIKTVDNQRFVMHSKYCTCSVALHGDGDVKDVQKWVADHITTVMDNIKNKIHANVKSLVI